jgi:hypothetical protein
VEFTTMSRTNVAMLGAITGATIFLGLPIGRLRAPAASVRAARNAITIGILLFLLWDVLAHAWAPVDAALADKRSAPAVGKPVRAAVGLAVGLVGLVYFQRTLVRRPTTQSAFHASRLALLIAVGIGLLNFAEGLAVGNSAGRPARAHLRRGQQDRPQPHPDDRARCPRQTGRPHPTDRPLLAAAYRRVSLRPRSARRRPAGARSPCPDVRSTGCPPASHAIDAPAAATGTGPAGPAPLTIVLSR